MIRLWVGRRFGFRFRWYDLSLMVFFRAPSSERRPDQARSHKYRVLKVNAAHCGSGLARDGAGKYTEDIGFENQFSRAR